MAFERLHGLCSEYDVLVKTVVIGECGVGKSALLLRYTEGEWNPRYIATIGVDFAVQTLSRDGKVIKLQLWDTAGQERFHAIATSYYRGAHAVMVVYDVTDRSSFERLPKWVGELAEHCIGDVPVMIVGNKVDQVHRREVSTEEGQDMAGRLGAMYTETSAMKADGVDSAFEDLVSAALPGRLDQVERATRKSVLLDGGESLRPESCLSRFKKWLW
eukprot:TRINITY_DN47266_c0_g1_i1.p1 TRINITY_DN47266_c0_g1~~TRINITY_DN47266_c0_g1_i1.p1  ORF type:complete len:235 (+),score=92.72 TRINITY_DN47266_c0_g1_i1:60-707(+)